MEARSLAAKHRATFANRHSRISAFPIRVRMHGLVRDPVTQWVLVERQKDVQQLIVDPPYPVEYLSQIVRVHERHWDDDVL